MRRVPPFGLAVVCLFLFAGGAVTTSASRAAGANWGTGIEAVLPANALVGLNQDVTVGAISCPSAGNCSAVGTYMDSAGHREGLLLTETTGGWANGVEAVLPPNAQQAGLGSVSCPSVGYCSAVGSYTTGKGSDLTGHGVLLTERAGRWRKGHKAPLPGNAVPPHAAPLSSVSCASVGNCTAVGAYVGSASYAKGLLLTERAGIWKKTHYAPLPANAGAPSQAGLSQVSCASAGNCGAIGTYVDRSGRQEGLLLTEKAGKWHAEEAALPADAAAQPWALVQLDSISCPSAGNCSAVGGYVDGPSAESGADTGHGLLLSETAGRWTRGVEPVLPANLMTNQGVSVNSVSCAAAGECSAVGYYFYGVGGQESLLLSEIGTRWSRAVVPPLPANVVPGGGGAPEGLSSISCSSPRNCSAIGGGYLTAGGGLEGLLETETAGTWMGLEAAVPWSSIPSWGTSAAISCPTDQFCGGAETVAVAALYVGDPGSGYYEEDNEGVLFGGSNTPRCLVTKLKGKTLTAARDSLSAHACAVGKITHAFSRKVKKGRVISQRPRPGTELRQGAEVNLVTSKGSRH